MKAVVFSDSHGRARTMRLALLRHRDADICFFLGDGLKDLEKVALDFPNITFLSVAGNCDWYADGVEREALFVMEGRRVLYLHGHTVGVKGGIGAAIAMARRLDADILLYGHTHDPYEGCLTDGEKPLYVMNPGSVGEPYDGRAHYGILDVRDNGILMSHGTIDG